MGKGFFNHSSSNKKQLLDIDGNNLSISGGNTVQLPGGANFNGFFPNGYEFIQESRDFLESDVGKLLILAGDEVPVELTMPNIMPFEVGDILGIMSIGESHNYQPAYGADKNFPSHYGNNLAETLILQCEDFTSLDFIKTLLPISTSTIYDSKDNKNKTLYRYILDNLGNTGILFPNGVQELGSGEYEYTADMAGKFIAIHNETKLIKPIGGYPFQNGDLICIALKENYTEGTFSLTDKDNIKLLNGEYVILYALDIGGTIHLLPFSTPIIQDGIDENFNPIWKTANRCFYDNRSSYRTITLGTVTYEDINNAPADSIVRINIGTLPLDLVGNYFIDKLLLLPGVPFTEGVIIGSPTLFQGDTEIATIQNEIFASANYSQFKVNVGVGLENSWAESRDIYMEINFDKGNGEVNPQDFTAGYFTIRAIVGLL